MLEKVLSISGRSGLFKMLAASKKAIIVEVLADGTRMPVYPHEKMISLNDISIYTNDEDVPLRDVFTKLYEVLKGEKTTLDLKNADKKALQDFLATALPDFDRDRVHNSDIIKIAKWYNLLIGAGFTSFEEDKEAEDAGGNEKEAPEAIKEKEIPAKSDKKADTGKKQSSKAKK